MTSKHDNDFELTCSAISSISYISGSAVVSSGQPFDVPPTIENKGSGKWKITFKSGRHKTGAVADSFKNTVGSTSYAMITSSSGDTTPDELNFYFGLYVTLTLPNGGTLDRLPIYLGQGSNTFHNNWWFGARAMVNLSGTAVVVANQSGQVAWRANVSMSNSSMNWSPVWPDKPSSFELLDVWGEGRIVDGSMVTGFTNSLNLNKYSQLISNGPNKNESIPQQVLVFDYNSPQFPIKDGAVQFITMMGAPMVPVTACEIVRVLDPKTGVVILYDLDPTSISTFEANMGNLMYKPHDTLQTPFNEITIPNPRVYGFPGVTDDVEDKDEL